MTRAVTKKSLLDQLLCNVLNSTCYNSQRSQTDPKKVPIKCNKEFYELRLEEIWLFTLECSLDQQRPDQCMYAEHHGWSENKTSHSEGQCESMHPFTPTGNYWPAGSTAVCRPKPYSKSYKLLMDTSHDLDLCIDVTTEGWRQHVPCCLLIYNTSLDNIQYSQHPSCCNTGPLFEENGGIGHG